MKTCSPACYWATFLDPFAADVTSGNPVHVDRAFQAGEAILHTALAG